MHEERLQLLHTQTFLFVMKIHHLYVIHIYTLLGHPLQKNKTPTVGLKPTTTRLRALRSAD